MFGRTKTPAPAAPTSATAVKPGGKGRPTPSRKQAEARNRHPLVGGPTVRPGASKEEKKAARTAQRQLLNEERAKAREAMMTGDERNLPARDKGPARRFARDYVDARRNLGEYFLPVAVVVLLAGLTQLRVATLISTLLLYAMALVVGIDCFLLRRRVNKLVTAKFGDNTPGVGGYAMMRALQLRRTRMPRPQVKRGQFPE